MPQTTTDFIKTELELSLAVPHGRSGGGCINQGFGLMTDKYGPVFVKANSKPESVVMFEGEYAGLRAIKQVGIVSAPKPIKVLRRQNPASTYLVTDYVEMRSLHDRAGALGTALANQHRYNEQLLKKVDKQRTFVHTTAKNFDDASIDYATQPAEMFGFHTNTCCGMIPQDNSWTPDWVTFYTRCRLEPQVQMTLKEKNDQELYEQFLHLLPLIPKFFDENVQIYPALLHGDLWSGNAAETVSETGTGPVVFDPAVFFGHSEYDLGITGMFGGFPQSFYNEYFKVCPKAAGFDDRQELYQLFHYLNHYNHFGSSYRGTCMKLFKSLIRRGCGK